MLKSEEAAVSGGFQPDYVAIPYAIFTERDLSHAAKLVYGRLKLYAGSHGRCYPKHETLAREVCISDRQLRSVLVELRNAGLVEWRRGRTSSVYTVFSDRKKTSDLVAQLAVSDRKKTSGETGGKLPVRSEENFRQKRSIENHHQKRSKKRSSAPSDVAGTSEESQSQSLSSENADDEKTKTGETILAREQLSDPDAELRLRLKERHADTNPEWKPEYIRDGWIEDIKHDLSEHGLTLAEFLKFDTVKTTNPAKLTNPVGHYRRLVKVMVLARKAVMVDVLTQVHRVMSGPPTEKPKCTCTFGMVNIEKPEEPESYCPNCDTGRDLRRYWEQKRAADKAAATAGDKAA